jgi:mannose-6-phosphate isomerase-like protein (cupin superfamily)
VTIPLGAGDKFDLGGFGVHWKINGDQTGQRFSVVHHPLAPRALAAPLHRHHREDEYSYVLSGTLGALLGDAVVTAEPGTWVLRPRNQWHTFWYAGDSPCEIIEVISAAGFEITFGKCVRFWPERTKFGELLRKYELDMDIDSVTGFCERFGLTIAGDIES